MPDLLDTSTREIHEADVNREPGDLEDEAAHALDRASGVTMDEVIDAAIFRRLFGVRQSSHRAEEEALSPREILVGDKDDPDNGDVRLKLTVDANADDAEIRLEEFVSSENDWLFKFIIRWDSTNIVFLVPDDASPGTSREFMRLGTDEDPLEVLGDLELQGSLELTDVLGSPRTNFASFTDGDTTPAVDGRVGWRTGNTTATTITRFDHADNTGSTNFENKTFFVLLIDDANTSIDFSSANIEGRGTGTVSLDEGSFLLCTRHGGDSETDAVTTVQLWGTSDLTQSDLGVQEMNSGLATNPNDVDTMIVSHGLGGTPDSVVITPANTAARDESPVYVDNLTNSSFDINVGSGVTTNTHFHWIAVRNA